MLRTGIHYKKVKGVGLLELMLSLAIIAVLLIMATRYYQTTSQSQKVNQAVSDIQAILAAAANYTAASPGSAFAITDLVSAGLLPANWSTETPVAGTANPWAGAYTATNVSGSPAVKITAGSVPLTACTALDQLMYQGYTVPTAGSACGSVSSGNTTYTATFGPQTTTAPS